MSGMLEAAWGKDTPDINHSPKPLQYTLTLKVANSISDQSWALRQICWMKS